MGCVTNMSNISFPIGISRRGLTQPRYSERRWARLRYREPTLPFTLQVTGRRPRVLYAEVKHRVLHGLAGLDAQHRSGDADARCHHHFFLRFPLFVLRVYHIFVVFYISFYMLLYKYDANI